MKTSSIPTSNVQIGDIASVKKGPFTHVGVVVPSGVLQNSPNSHERIVSWLAFSNGQPVHYTHTHSEAWLIMHRIEKILAAPRAYNPFTQNCEHTVNEVVYGVMKSPQLNSAFAGAIIGLVLVGIFSK